MTKYYMQQREWISQMLWQAKQHTKFKNKQNRVMVIEINSGFFFRDTDYKGPGGRLLGAGNILNTGMEGGSKNCSRLRMICALYSMDAILQLYIFKTLIQQLINQKQHAMPERTG